MSKKLKFACLAVKKVFSKDLNLHSENCEASFGHAYTRVFKQQQNGGQCL